MNGSVHARIAARSPTPWTAVTFENSWVNFGAGEQEAEYSKKGDDVRVRGQIKSGANGTTAFTLPDGFRPPATQNVTISNFNAGVVAALVQVQTSGACVIYTATPTDVSVAFSFSTTA